MSSTLPCQTFSEEKCRLPVGPDGPWNCCICRAVVDWLSGPYDTVYVQEVNQSKAIVTLLPAHSEDPPPKGSLLALNAATHSPEDIRVFLNCLANASDELWIQRDKPAPHSARHKP